MKKIFFIFVLVSCFAAGFAEEEEYTFDDLFEYFAVAPGSKLPPEGKRVKVMAGVLAVEDVSIDGDGMDYLIKSGTLKLSRNYSRLIYVYSENIKTSFFPSDGYWPSATFVINEIELVYTGKTAPAINGDGNRIEVPIFIAY